MKQHWLNYYEALQMMINNLQGNQAPHIEIDRADREKQIRSWSFC